MSKDPYDLSDLGEAVQDQKMASADPHDLSDIGTPVNDPNMGSQNMAMPQNQTDQMPFGRRYSADIMSGILNGINSLQLLPNHIANELAKHGQISQQSADHVPKLGGLENFDYAKTKQMGITDPSTTDKVLQGLTQYGLPAIGAQFIPGVNALADQGLIARLGAGAIQGAAGSAASSDNQEPIKNALQNALLQAGGNEAFRGATNLIGKPLQNYLVKYASQSAIPDLVDKIASPLTKIRDTINKNAFDAAADKYTGQVIPGEKSNWDKFNSQAKYIDGIDPVIGLRPDLSEHNNFLQDELDRLKGQSQRQSGFAFGNKPAQDILEELANKSQKGSFQDLGEYGQGINRYYQDEQTPGRSIPFDTLNKVSRNFKKVASDAIDKAGFGDTLGKSWNDANQSTIDRINTYHTNPNKPDAGGKNSPSSFIKFLNNESPYADRGNFVDDFKLTPGQDNSLKLQQLGHMIGHQGMAKDVLKTNYFRPSFSGNSINEKQFIDKYRGLSDTDQNLLFSPEERSHIESLGKLVNSFPQALKDPTVKLQTGNKIAKAIGLVGSPLTAQSWVRKLILNPNPNLLRQAVAPKLNNDQFLQQAIPHILNQSPAKYSGTNALPIAIQSLFQNSPNSSNNGAQ